MHKTYVESRNMFPKRYFVCARAQADPDIVTVRAVHVTNLHQNFPNFTGAHGRFPKHPLRARVMQSWPVARQCYPRIR